MSDQDQEAPASSSNSALVSALGGICGSSIGKLFVHPIDTIKAKIQVQSQTKIEGSVIMSIAKNTLKTEGVGGLYRGFAIGFWGSIPAAGLYFGSYEFFKKHTLEMQYFQERPFISYLAGGMFAETIACMMFVPIDVIKERRQVQATLGTFKYKNDLDAMRQIRSTEGIRGLYRAYGATVLSFGPFSALYFMFYENLKGMLVKNDVQTYLKKVNKEGEEGKQAS